MDEDQLMPLNWPTYYEWEREQAALDAARVREQRPVSTDEPCDRCDAAPGDPCGDWCPLLHEVPC